MSTGRMNQPLPPHLQMDSEQSWRHLEDVFEEDVDWLRGLRLEDKDEAIERSSPQDFDDEIGQTIKHPQLVPYRQTMDTEELKSHFVQAIAAIPELRTLFKARVVTQEFLLAWGAFQYRCGLVAASYFSRGDDLGHTRAGKAGAAAVSKKRQRKWVAHLLLRQLEVGRDRQRAERDVARAIRQLLDAGDLPTGFPRKWFEEILGRDKQLKSTYSQKHFSGGDISDLAAEPTNDIPPTNIPIPKT